MSLDDLSSRVPPSGTDPETTVRRVDRAVPQADKGTRAEEWRLQLADEIVRGVLAPGSALDETDIARRFGVSRTPVREALRQLVASGLVEAPAPRGDFAALSCRVPRSNACPACSRRWRSSKPCAPDWPPNG